MTLEITYCCDCEWFVTDGEHGSRERTSLAIDHASATGHETDTLRIESSTSTSTTSSAASAASRAIGIGLSRPEQGHYGVDHRDDTFELDPGARDVLEHLAQRDVRGRNSELDGNAHRKRSRSVRETGRDGGPTRSRRSRLVRSYDDQPSM
jgi:hypothetical protein